MGFHACQFCFPQGFGSGSMKSDKDMAFGPYSSADVTLSFKSERKWEFPHTGLLHYITEHGYLPPSDFIDDVMNGEVLEGQFAQTKSPATRVGYLTEPGFPTGQVPNGFVVTLLGRIEAARNTNNYMSFRQTRGV